MELLVLVALAVLAIPVGLIWVIVSHSKLSTRVVALEAELARLRAAPPSVPAVAAPVVAPMEATAPPPETVAEDPAPVSAPAASAPQPAGPAPAAPLPPPGPDIFDRAGRWLRDNWVYAVAAVSLAAAGVFLVQYGMERGLLPPGLRIAAGIAFGLALIGAGEVIRRRHGDGPEGATAYLPSVFSGAGIVSVFAALLAGRLLYGLIGPEVTFAGLVLTALGAVVLGWLHGPLLAALGLVGASVAPFLTGGGDQAPSWLVAHYLIVAALGLGIDTLRRWGWVSVLALALAYLGGAATVAAGAEMAAYLLLVVALVVLAIAIPARGLWPDQGGPSLVEVLRTGRLPDLTFPMRLAVGSMGLSVAILALPAADPGTEMLAFVLLAGLGVGLLLWADRAPALHDLSVIAAAGFALRMVTEATAAGTLWIAFLEAAPDGSAPEVGLPEPSAPLTVTVLMALASGFGLALALRSRRGTAHPATVAAAGAALPALAALAAEVFWLPATVLGAYPWAMHVILMAAVMVGQASLMARAEVAEPRRRTAHAVLAALVLIALALFILTTKAALSLALTVLVVVAAALDRRFRLPELSWAVMAGVVVLGYRLSVDPGLIWALEGPFWPVLLSYLGPVAGFAAALWLLRGMERAPARAFLESALAATLALLADILLLRWLEEGEFFVLFSTLALPWLVLALVQLYRLQLGGWMRFVRAGLAVLAGGVAALGLSAALLYNPVVSGEWVTGPLVLDTLLVAYGLPGFIMLASVRFLPHLPRWLRWGLLSLGTLFAAAYAVMEIRRFWRGDDLSVPGTSQPELYTYTVALLILGAVLLWQAILRGSQTLRRAAMAVIALTSAKVFLIDAAGLTGLTRVFSFLALGLSLAGLAALNRWAAARSGPDRTPPL
jgi:uncharacterized membrane protein